MGKDSSTRRLTPLYVAEKIPSPTVLDAAIVGVMYSDVYVKK